VPDTLDVYVFRDSAFAPAGDTLVCIARRRQMERFVAKREVASAFSGHAVYWRWPWKTYVGVWGRKNGSRFRRFLRERGAELTIHREAPPKVRLCYLTTESERRRVRSLPPRAR
jgi:hypothetical protein